MRNSGQISFPTGRSLHTNPAFQWPAAQNTFAWPEFPAVWNDHHAGMDQHSTMGADAHFLHSTNKPALSVKLFVYEKMSGLLVLWWTMWQPTLEEPWHWTYAWADFDSPQNDEPSNHDQYTQDCISNSMWCTRPYNDHQSLRSGMACNPQHMGWSLCLPPVYPPGLIHLEEHSPASGPMP